MLRLRSGIEMARKLLVLLLVLGLAPGLWLRSEPPPPDYSQELVIEELADARGSVGELELEGAWRLDSRNSRFGGYSALAMLDDGRLLAASDRGDYLLFPRPGTPGAFRIDRLKDTAARLKFLSDFEALARDPETGRLWAALEGRNTIIRFTPDLKVDEKVQPKAIARWGANSGPEAMERLADGRFLLLSEGNTSWLGTRHRGVLFATDPVEDSDDVIGFFFESPEGYRPVDLAQIPDGRVLVLLRKLDFSLPPGFASAIAVADPAEIEENGVWTARIIAHFDTPAPRENYEGLAVVPQASGALSLWVIADDNASKLQETYVLRFSWEPSKAPASPD